jgi:oligopeptide transport system ATP-binding protein
MTVLTSAANLTQSSSTSGSDATPLLRVRDLRVSFETPFGTVRAVNGVSYDLERGQVLVIIGESGSGKSVSSLAIMGAITSKMGHVGGEVLFKGQNLLTLSPEAMRKIRGNQIAMIPQDPMVSFDPVYPVGVQIVEAIRSHRSVSESEAMARAIELLRQVGIPRPELRATQFPHQFSGGMAQRALIAMALSCDPEILIADEPTTALDVTVQAQILDLLLQLQQTLGLAILFITHDMGVAARVADRIAVMYAGRIVEQGTSDDVFYEPKHPYTWGLLQSTLRIDEKTEGDLKPIAGMPPNLLNLPSGCKFNPRCPYVMPVCREIDPPLEPLSSTHAAACHLTLAQANEYRPRPS